MVLPQRAPVRPRVFGPGSEVASPLEDEIRALLAAGGRGVVYLTGPMGSGKSAALRHLAAVLPAGAPVHFLAESTALAGSPALLDGLVVCAASSPGDEPRAVSYRLAPWGEDDLIEYLLAVHRGRSASVMARVRKADHARLRGVPELWQIVLDQLANDPSIPDVRGALGRYLQDQLPDTDLVERARSGCLNALTNRDAGRPSPAESLVAAGFAPDVVRILRHAQVQLLLAADRVVADLRTQADCDCLALRLPRALVQAVAADIAGDDRALQHLRGLLAGPSWSHAMAASLLHAAKPGWIPELGPASVLTGAYLEHAAWSGVELPRADLREADLSHADLRWANLDGADVSRASLRQTRLANASLNGLRAFAADLSGADLASARGAGTFWDGATLEAANLEDADLKGASFRGADCTAAMLAGANLAEAVFAEVELKGADFSGADLRGACLSKLRLRDTVFAGACFARADLSGSDLEGMELAGVDCRRANLEGALLTGAVLSDADLRGACLREAGLGEVNLERACLRGADLRGVSFHMGSTRSGLLFTPIASEGTRTGFYTDDADEQYFKAPEEIRKANLCGADLRGARVKGVDFYLVDLRGALYGPRQEQHFRRCRAILERRAGGTA
jgi:uncharacterized protein YjbI with pentapeptide repeats